MSDRRYRDDWAARSPPRRRSRSPPRPFRRPSNYSTGVSYDAYRPESSRDDRRGSTSNDRGADSPTSSRVGNVSSPASHRGGGESPHGFRNQDPRVPARVETNLYRDPRLNATASASAADSPKDAMKASAPGQKISIGAQGPAAVDPRKESVNGTLDDKEFQAKGFEALFSQLFDNLNSLVPLILQKETAKVRCDRETREARRHNALMMYPSAKEQFEEAKQSSSEAFDQIDAKLKQHIHLRDEATKKLGVQLSSMIPATLSQPNGSSETVPTSELQQMKARIESLEKSSSKHLETKLSDLKSEYQGFDERLMHNFDHVEKALQLGEGTSKELNTLKDQVTVIDNEIINHRFRLDEIPPHFLNLDQSVSDIKGSLSSLRNEKADLEINFKTKFEEEQRRLEELDNRLDANSTKLEEQQRRREELERRLDEDWPKFGQRIDELRGELDEVKNEVKRTHHTVSQRNERLSSQERQFQAPPRSQSRALGDVEFGNRLTKIEAAAESLKQEIQELEEYQKRKEELLSEEIETLKVIPSELEPKILQAQTEIRQAQMDISQAHIRLNKTIDRVGRVERTSASAQSSKHASPHPQTPQSETATVSMTDLQKQFIKTSNIVIEVQRQVTQHTQTMAAYSHALQALESRYNNLTTEPLVKAMVQNMQEMYPYASNTQREIEVLKAELLALQEKSNRTPPQFQIYQDHANKVDKDIQELSRKSEQEETRLTQEESKRLENWLKWQEERQELVQRIEEMKQYLDKMQNKLTEPISDLSARVELVEKDMHLGRFADEISSEATPNQGEFSMDDVGYERNGVNGHGGGRDRSSNRGELIPEKMESATLDTKRRSETARSSKLESRSLRLSDASAESPKLGKKKFLTQKKRKRPGDGGELGSG